MDSLNRIFGFVNEAKRAKGKAMIPSHHQKNGPKKNFGTGKKNRYDHDHGYIGMKEESKMPEKPKPKDMTIYPEGHGGLRTRFPVSQEKWNERKKFPRGKPKPGMVSKKIGEGVVSEVRKPKHTRRVLLDPKTGEKIVWDENLGRLDQYKERGAFRKKRVEDSTEIITVLSILKEAYQDDLISEEAFLTIADPIVRSLTEKKRPQVPMDQGRERNLISKKKDINLSKKKKLPKLTDKDKEPPSKDETPW